MLAASIARPWWHLQRCDPAGGGGVSGLTQVRLDNPGLHIVAHCHDAAHHNLEAYLDAYIKAAGIGENGKSPPFRSAAGRTDMLTKKPMNRVDAWRMVQRRAANLGTQVPIGCHTFRATGITAYLDLGEGQPFRLALQVPRLDLFHALHRGLGPPGCSIGFCWCCACCGDSELCRQHPVSRWMAIGDPLASWP
jgi:hypothetical protein